MKNDEVPAQRNEQRELLVPSRNWLDIDAAIPLEKSEAYGEADERALVFRPRPLGLEESAWVESNDAAILKTNLPAAGPLRREGRRIRIRAWQTDANATTPEPLALKGPGAVSGFGRGQGSPPEAESGK